VLAAEKLMLIVAGLKGLLVDDDPGNLIAMRASVVDGYLVR